MTDTVSQYREDIAYCSDLVKTHDKDRYLATLFAPADRRRHLFALYALNCEVAQVSSVVSDPNLGEIRLRWWADAVESVYAGQSFDHPVLRAYAFAVEYGKLPKQPVLDLIEARRFDLYSDPMPRLNDLEGYAGETASAVFQLAVLLLAGPSGSKAHNACGHAGVAWTLTRILRRLPELLARGQVFVPEEMLAERGLRVRDLYESKSNETVGLVLAVLRQSARRHLSEARVYDPDVSLEALPALLPLSVLDGYLRAMEKPGHDPLRQVCEVAQWRRQLALLRASWRKRY